MNPKKWLDRHFPVLYEYLYYYLKINLLKCSLIRKKRIKIIKKRCKVNVVFFASTLGMWRYQEIYDRLIRDSRFNCKIFIHPFLSYERDAQEKEDVILTKYFKDRNIPYVDVLNNEEEAYSQINKFNPDILFYPQPYLVLFGHNFNYLKFKDRLLCYAPYAIYTVYNKWLSNSPLLNIAWKLFYPTVYHLNEAKQLAFNHGRNVIIAGNPLSKDLMSHPANDPWKKQATKKIRLIWAPHFTIEDNGALNRASFLWLNETMKLIANQYKDIMQVAFKPHPRLKTALYQHKEWGHEKTDEYYEFWRNGDNTQLEEGNFASLFATSDAMIHDCGSFTAEYLYTKKPVMFVTNDIEKVCGDLNEFGKKCIEQHYIGSEGKEIFNFIDNVVLKGKDIKKNDREDFFNNILKSMENLDFGECVYRTLLKEFKWDIQ